MGDLNKSICEKEGVKTIKEKSIECTRLCFFCGKIFPTTSGLYAHHKTCKLNSSETSCGDSKTLESAGSLICVYCGKAFAFKSGLSRHERFCKQSEFSCYQCHICFSNFSRMDNFKNHIRNCSSAEKNKLKNIRGSRCIYANCSAVFFQKKKLALHLKNFHRSKIEEERFYNFQSMEDFLKWKQIEEEKTHSCFTKHSGVKGTTIYYHCQHDGSSKPHCKVGDLPRKTNRKVKKGLVKQDRVCLARITVKVLDNGSCKVTYEPTHSHNLNTNNYHKSPLLIETVKFINHQLAMGVAPKDCLKDLSDGSFHRNINSAVVSIQESKPIFINPTETPDYVKRMKIKNGKDDSISVMIQAVLLSKEEPNPIIVYKPLGASKVIGPNKVDKLSNTKDLFMLGLQTKQQRNMMLNSKIILSISISEETNAYGYSLLTLVVIDKHNRGYPVGFFISSSMDYDSMSYFFAALKVNCSNFDLNSINYLILPQTPGLYNAIKEGWQMDVAHIWCLWDLHKDFQSTLFNLIPEHLVQEMYNFLSTMIYCKNAVELKDLINKFICEYAINAPEFIKHFKNKFMPHIEQWSMAYRSIDHGRADTTVFNVALHNCIKARHKCELHQQRLDALINILLDLEEDYYKKATAEESVGVPFGVGDIPIHHANGLKISDEAIVQVNDTLWEVRIDEKSLEKCEVLKYSDSCPNEKCYFVCTSKECNGLCSHLLACTCTEKNPLCKHIHKIREFTCRQESLSVDISGNEIQVPSTSDADKGIVTNRFENINHYMQQLSLMIKQQNVSSEFLEHVEMCLEKLVIEGQSLSNFVKHETDTNCFELEYEEMGKTDMRAETSTEADALSIDNTLSFTPSLNFAALNEIILRCGLEELSLLDLKLLDPFLTLEEISYIQECENFRNEWMYPSVVNAFCYQLQSHTNLITVINSDVAFILARNETLNEFCRQKFLEKDVLVLPMNLSYKYWTCIAIYHQKKEIIYFNSKDMMLEIDKLVIQNLQFLISEAVPWKVSLANYDFQNDYTSCGAQVCHFVEQTALEQDLTPLIDFQTYRKHIYDTIVGGCLNRAHFSDVECGTCKKLVCAYVDDEIAQLSICCDKCNQWYHIQCVGLDTMDITNMRFTCPV